MSLTYSKRKRAKSLAARYLRAYDGLAETKELSDIYHVDFLSFAEQFLIDLCGYKKDEPEPIVYRPKKIKDEPPRRKVGTRPPRTGEIIDLQKHSSIVKHEKQIIQEIDKTIDDSKPDWYKKAWRKIMLQVHPDRIDLVSKDEIDKLERLKIGSRLRNNADYELLVACCNTLEIKIDLSVVEQERMMRVALHKIQGEIKNMHSTVSWVWGESIIDNNVRVELMKNVLKSNNIELPDDAVIIQYIIKNIT